jgi:hypothetical protein
MSPERTVARENNVVASGVQDLGSIVEEVNGVVELVMGELGEVFFGHNRGTAIGDVQSNLLWVQEEECT